MDQEIALTYVRKRKRRKRAAIISGISAIGITIFLIIAFCMLTVDRFTITIDQGPGLCLSIDEEKTETTTLLAAPPLLKASDTQYTDIPENIEDGIGSKNTDRYFAYSFYLGGVADNTNLINYEMNMYLKDFSQDLEQAIKIMIIRNGTKRVYSQDGKAIYNEPNRQEETKEIIGYSIPFQDNKHIILQPYSIVPGEFDKFTVVIWIDGWESVNSMKGGTFQADLKFSTLSYNN